MRTTFSLVAPFLFVTGALAACTGSSGPSGSGSVNGTVDATTFQVGSAFGQLGASSSSTTCNVSPDGGSTCTSTSSGQALEIFLGNRSGLSCDSVEQSVRMGTKFANLDALLLAVGSQGGSLTPTTYTISGASGPGRTTSGASAFLGTSNASCQSALGLEATAGTVTLTDVSSTHAAGTYTATFGSQGTFTGSFDVPICELPDGGVTSNTDAGTCQQ